MSQEARQIAVAARDERPTHRDAPPRAASSALFWATLALCLGAFIALVPFWAPLVLAVWTAIIARPLHRMIAKRIHRRKGGAALVTVLLVVVFLTPISIIVLSLSGAALELGQRLLESKSGAEALRSLAVNGQASTFDPRQLNVEQVIALGRQHGASALGVAKAMFGAATLTVLAVVTFVSAFYTFLLEGQRLHEWLLVHSPLGRGQFHRLSSVFAEVGHGLLVGVGLTALLQGATATIGYVACGVPQPLVLGLVTVFASLIPAIGAGLVWAPVSAGLALAGRPGAALAMLAVGCFVSIIDNVLRPLLAKYGQLRLHGLLLFVAMLGGIAVFGAGGLLLGPLFVRLAVEALSMMREASPATFPEG